MVALENVQQRRTIMHNQHSHLTCLNGGSRETEANNIRPAPYGRVHITMIYSLTLILEARQEYRPSLQSVHARRYGDRSLEQAKRLYRGVYRSPVLLA